MPNMNHQQEISYTTSAAYPQMGHLPLMQTTAHGLFYAPIDNHLPPRLVVVGNPYQQQQQQTQQQPQQTSQQTQETQSEQTMPQQQKQHNQQLHHHQQQQQQHHNHHQKQQPQHQKQQSQQQLQQNQQQLHQQTISKKHIKHFIDGHWIIETTKPLTDIKPKSLKKKKLKAALSQSSPAPVATNTNSSTHTVNNINNSNNNINNSASNNTNEQPANDVARIRAKMPNWSVQDVVKFIESHEDIRNYAPRFAEDDVDGKALLLMIDRNLNLQMLASMFKHGPAMKIEAVLSKYKQE